MRRISEKREKIYAAAKEWRQALLRSVGRCEWCHKGCGRLDLHEISQGSSRVTSLSEQACVLVLGRGCHDILHRMPERRQVGLAILKLNRPQHFSLERFYAITSRRFPDLEEVEKWVARLSLRPPPPASAATCKKN